MNVEKKMLMPSLLRRCWVGIALSVTLPLSGLAQTLDGNEISVGAEQVQQYLVTEFPQDYGALGGLLSLQLSRPQFAIPASGQRLTLGIDASAATAGGAAQPIGRLWLSSGLRFDAQRKALLLDQPTLDRIESASPGQTIDQRTRTLINLWLADYAEEEPLYQMDAATAALLGGMTVQSTAIENGRIVVRIDPAAGESTGVE